MQWR